MKYCKFCNKPLEGNKKKNKYCSKECYNESKKQRTIDIWVNKGIYPRNGNRQFPKPLRKYLLQEHGYKCEKCGWGEMNTVTGLYPLEIHHIDGDRNNNKKDNLQVLCPNCHSLTDNFRALNCITINEPKEHSKYTCVDCGKEVTRGSLRCVECNGIFRKRDKPISRDDLKFKIRSTSFEKIGEKYSVSGNTVKKWCRWYGLPDLRRDIDMISDIDWEAL